MELPDSSTSTGRQHKGERGNPFDGITPNASSSSSTVMKVSYDVFINHRGSDTKHNLASTIYHILASRGLRVFLDSEDLELGYSIPQGIEEAIRTAALHIAIFSKNYAESPWCLTELSYILKTGAPIIPVFYHVMPFDLRWVAQGKGCYAGAFSRHEEKGRYPSTVLEEWRTALHMVSTLSGLVFNSDTGDEGIFLKTVVNSVVKVMNTVPLDVSKDPFGMDEIVQDFERCRQEYIESGQQPQLVGIVGLGGAGKTTLAKELYNRQSCSFEHSSFLRDVREAAQKNSLHSRQKKLLEDLGIQTASFHNAREGKRNMEKRLISLRVLIVLDDVDHEDQLDALLPREESLGSGSLVIITTRGRDVLTNWGIKSIYKMKPLQRLHAKQLFCWHAFLRPCPLEGFENLVENFIDACQGLPLSLKVIGRQLKGVTSKAYWNSLLNKIQRILPKDIFQILKQSYDALDEEEKDVFLDIACFFIGERKSAAIAVWDGSGWSGDHSWQRLQNMELVKVIEVCGEEHIGMLDQLRALARQIAEAQPPSRIWSERQNLHIMNGRPIRGIKTTGICEGGELSLKTYTEMMRISNLRAGLTVLAVKGNEISQECGDLSRGLLWLRWHNFEHKSIPSWLSLENIRVLEIIYPKNLETLWDDVNAPLQLRELLIEDAPELRSIPRSIGHLKHLKRLFLNFDYEGSRISSLPEEFCQLHSLEHLVLLGCHMLSNLPNNFGDLVNLRHINLSRCRCLEMLPVSFKELIHLQYLNLSYCVKLAIRPDILENIKKLNVLDVSGCDRLEVLPHNVTNQASLGKLDLRSTVSLRELPASIGQLSILRKLEIVGCPLLTRLPNSLGNLLSLATLTLDGCNKLESLPQEAGQLSDLKALTIERCPELYEMPSLGGLVCLRNLKVTGCPKIEKIEGLDHLTSLENVLVWTSWTVPGMHRLGSTEQLQTLDLQSDHILAFEPCIQTMQVETSPRETTITARMFPQFQSVLDSLTFPGLTTVNSMEKVVDYSYFARWSLISSDTNLSNAAIVCIIARSFGEGSAVDINGRRRLLDKGEWIVISVMRDVSPLIKNGGSSIQASIDLVHSMSDESHEIRDEVLDGRLIVGETGSVAQAFNKVFQTLCSSTSLTLH